MPDKLTDEQIEILISTKTGDPKYPWLCDYFDAIVKEITKQEL